MEYTINPPILQDAANTKDLPRTHPPIRARDRKPHGPLSGPSQSQAVSIKWRLRRSNGNLPRKSISEINKKSPGIRTERARSLARGLEAGV